MLFNKNLAKIGTMARFKNCANGEKTMKKESYNGWKNWETWNCRMWFDGGCFRCHTAEQCKKMVEEIEVQHVPQSGFLRDIFESAMSEIDWQEIADAEKEDNEAEETEETEEIEKSEEIEV